MPTSTSGSRRSVLYAGTALRAAPAILAENTKGQPGLWAYGISGDKPIILAFIADFDQTSLVAQLLTAHTYLRLKGLETDLVLLTGPGDGDLDDLPGLILRPRAGQRRPRPDRQAGRDLRPEAGADPGGATGSCSSRMPGSSCTVTRGRSPPSSIPERTHPLPDPFVPTAEPSHREVESRRADDRVVPVRQRDRRVRRRRAPST